MNKIYNWHKPRTLFTKHISRYPCGSIVLMITPSGHLLNKILFYKSVNRSLYLLTWNFFCPLFSLPCIYLLLEKVLTSTQLFHVFQTVIPLRVTIHTCLRPITTDTIIYKSYNITWIVIWDILTRRDNIIWATQRWRLFRRTSATARTFAFVVIICDDHCPFRAHTRNG